MAALADRSVGYEGSVRESDWMELAGFGAQYSVLGEGSLAVTNVPTSDRTVRVAPAAAPDGAWGKGVLDFFDTPTQLQAQALAAGTRYDTVCVARNRATKESRLVIIAGTNARAIAASRATFGPSSQIDHQPLAIIRIQAQAGTSGVITAIDDVRCWAANGGVVARSTLAQGYLDRIGATLRIDGFEWSREFNRDGTAEWVRTGVGRLLRVHAGEFFKLPDSGRFGAGTQVWGNAVQNIASVDIPDPGVPYRISAVATGFWGAETEGRYDLDFMAGDSLLSLWPYLGVFNATYRRWSIDPSQEIFTGPKTVYLRARKLPADAKHYGAVSVEQRNIAARVWEA